MWQIEEKNLQAFPDDVNDFSIIFFHIYDDLVILTFRILSCWI